MTRRFVAIMNPVSGRRNMMPVVSRVARELGRFGGELEVAVTGCTGHATELAAGLQRDVEAVLVVGGDGTVCEVVNGLIGRLTPIVILRTGTENLLARELRMPLEAGRVAHTLLRGRAFACDVGVINNRRFLAVTGAGFDAECVDRLSRHRRGHITRSDYFWPIWRVYWAHRFPVLRVESDGACIFEGRGLALVGVIGRYSAGMRLLANARYDDGLLDLCIMPCATRTGLLLHVCRIWLGRHVNHRSVIYRQCRTVRISSPEKVPVEVDGDVGGYLPAECSILPGAARFLRLGPERLPMNPRGRSKVEKSKVRTLRPST